MTPIESTSDLPRIMFLTKNPNFQVPGTADGDMNTPLSLNYQIN